MVVAFDAVGPGSGGGGTTASAGATSATWSHTCTGSNRALVVGVAIGLGGAGTTTCTYNSVAMTSLGLIASNNQTSGYCQLFGLINPASGANTVAITTTTASIAGGSVSFTGAGSFGTAVTAAGAGTPSVAVTGTTSGNMVVDVACNGAAITSSNQTQRWLRNNNLDTAAGNGASSTAAAGGSITMSYVTTADWWGIVAVEVLAATVSVAPPYPGLLVSRLRPYFG